MFFLSLIKNYGFILSLIKNDGFLLFLMKKKWTTKKSQSILKCYIVLHTHHSAPLKKKKNTMRKLLGRHEAPMSSVEPVHLLSGICEVFVTSQCLVNAYLSGQTSQCLVNAYLSGQTSNCLVNAYLSGQTSQCLVNAYLSGQTSNCLVNAYLSGQTSQCLVNAYLSGQTKLSGKEDLHFTFLSFGTTRAHCVSGRNAPERPSSPPPR